MSIKRGKLISKVSVIPGSYIISDILSILDDNYIIFCVFPNTVTTNNDTRRSAMSMLTTVGALRYGITGCIINSSQFLSFQLVGNKLYNNSSTLSTLYYSGAAGLDIYDVNIC